MKAKSINAKYFSLTFSGLSELSEAEEYLFDQGAIFLLRNTRGSHDSFEMMLEICVAGTSIEIVENYIKTKAE